MAHTTILATAATQPPHCSVARVRKRAFGVLPDQTDAVLVVRGTKKLRDRIGTTSIEDVTATTALGEWYANAVFWQPHMAFLVNATTLLPVVFPLAPAATALDRAPRAIADVLTALDVDRGFVERELAEMRTHTLLPTASRSVLGVMRELIELGGLYYKQHALTDPIALSLQLAEVPCGPLFNTTVSPDRETRAFIEARHGHGGPAR